MFPILFTRTFLIVGGMLLITTLFSYSNKKFDSLKEVLLSIFGIFFLLFLGRQFINDYPLNLMIIALFSALSGWMIGPVISSIGEETAQKRYLKSRGIKLKKGESMHWQVKLDFIRDYDVEANNRATHKIVFQTISATTFAVFATAATVFLTQYNFSLMESYLLIALLLLLVMTILNFSFFRSKFMDLLLYYFGAGLFTLYLFVDFYRMEQMANDTTWKTAADISIRMYLDIFNLFLSLLGIQTT